MLYLVIGTRVVARTRFDNTRTHTYRWRSENRLSGRGNGTGAFWRAQDIRNGSFYAARLFFPSPPPLILSSVPNKKCRFNASKTHRTCTEGKRIYARLHLLVIVALLLLLLLPPSPVNLSLLLSTCTCARYLCRDIAILREFDLYSCPPDYGMGWDRSLLPPWKTDSSVPTCSPLLSIPSFANL